MDHPGIPGSLALETDRVAVDKRVVHHWLALLSSLAEPVGEPDPGRNSVLGREPYGQVENVGARRSMPYSTHVGSFEAHECAERADYTITVFLPTAQRRFVSQMASSNSDHGARDLRMRAGFDSNAPGRLSLGLGMGLPRVPQGRVDSRRNYEHEGVVA